MRSVKAWSTLPMLIALALIPACSAAEDVAGVGGATGQTPTVTDETTESPTTEPGQTEPTGDLPAGFGPGPEGSGIDRFYDQEVTWSDCGAGTECADIWVPLSYAEPDGDAITIKAKRDPARDPAKRRGSLFINPGGPGVSGIEYVGYVGFDRSVQSVYDVVGFDPRGVATSTPVDCQSDGEMDEYLASDPTPDTGNEVKTLQQLWAEFAGGCVDRSGPLLEHVSTVEVARDLDIMRAVVGDQKLNYWGVSYGTFIGATYAALFPDSIDRMVLDGAVDPLQSPHAGYVAQSKGFETALTAYLEDCVAKGNCPLGDSVEAGRTRLQQFFKDVDQQPLPTQDGRELTEGLAVLGVILPLYGKETWSLLTQAMQEALNGSGNTLLFLADFYADRSGGGYKTNRLEINPAVNCLDNPENETISSLEAKRDEFVKASPTFGPTAVYWGYGCSNWPVKAAEESPDYSADGAPPIVVVGTTRDPATPYHQAVSLAESLSSGVLLTREGDGHGAYGVGNSCIDNSLDTYLIDGTVPPDGKQC